MTTIGTAGKIFSGEPGAWKPLDKPPRIQMDDKPAACHCHGREPQRLAGLIDHTILKPDATDSEIRQACLEAREHGYASVCVHPAHVARASGFLKGSGIPVC